MDLIDELRRVVGDTHVLTAPDRTASYTTDWTRRFAGRARCVVRPGSTEEVTDVLRACHRHGAPVVAQGGNTGLVGASVPRNDEVLLSLTRLDALEPVDVDAATVVVGAGVTLAALQAHAAAAGLGFGVDLAARESATVGGMVATNAGGLHVVRHGSMRQQVRGVEAVLADGRVLRRLGGLAKDSTGYDLPGLLVGSEGTLGIVTQVCLRLVEVPALRATALLALPDVAAAVRVAGRVRGLPTLEAVEFVTAQAMRTCLARTGLPDPLPEVAGSGACFLMVECAGPDDQLDTLAAAVETDDVLGVAVATDRPDRERLWAYRERISEAIAAEGIPVKLDVALPMRDLAAFVDDLPGLVGEVDDQAEVVVFGHLAEANLHVNVLSASDAERVEDVVLREVLRRGGSISSEHGVGMAKRNWMPDARDATDLAVMRAVKAAFDPDGLLNPGVLFPGPTA